MEFDFAANTKVADINKIPADFRGLYKQDGESHVLDTDHAGVKSAIAAISGLNNALKASRAEAKNKGTPIDLSPLKEFGETPEAIKTTVQGQLKALQEQVKGVNLEKIKEDLAKDWKTKVDGADKKANALQGQLFKHLVIGEATTAISAEKGNARLLMPFVREQVKVVEKPDTGEAIVQVVDGAGDIRYSGVTGAPMSIKELVAEMKAKDDYKALFASEAAQGSGSPAGGGNRPAAGGAANKAATTGEKSSVSKIAAGLSAMRKR